MIYDILIIGGGPAGLTAATYGCRAGNSVLVLEKETFGGQITWSPKVENFPGFVSVSGAELGDRSWETGSWSRPWSRGRKWSWRRPSP